MHPKVHAHFQDVAHRYDVRGPFLEVGAGAGANAVLAGEHFRSGMRHALNAFHDMKQEDGIVFHKGNANDMRGIFDDEAFGTVVSNATLEHDQFFWRSLSEMKRVLRPGGFLIIGVPGYVPRTEINATISGVAEETGPGTVVFDVHGGPFDYWRFGRDAVEQVFFADMELKELKTILFPPRLIGVGAKAGA